MSRTGSIEDRLAIRERIEAYSDAVFRADGQAWIANWSADPIWRLPGLEVRGRDAILAAWTQAMSAFRLAAFFATPGEITVAGDTATARVYAQETLIAPDGGVRRIIGAYDDALVREDGAWRFQARSYQILHDQTDA